MAVKGKRRPHVLAVPFPAQGHVRPLMKLCRRIASRGIKVTFVNTEYIHGKVFAAMSEEDKKKNSMQLISIPDGLPPEDDRSPGIELMESVIRTMPGNLTNLIEKINCENSGEKITCVIADITIGWILDVTQKLGAESVVFHPAAAAGMAMILQIPKLIRAGNLDTYGSVTKNELIDLSDNIPPWRRNELTWSIPGDLKTQKIAFECFAAAGKTANHAKWMLCNTFNELESSAGNLIPNFLPIGPLVSTNKQESSAIDGSFWLEDTTCFSWLEEQPIGSVIYVSFGSIAVFCQDQLNELALALELSGRPFLWVVRSNLANGSSVKYPNGFRERVAKRGKIVEWAPQEKVLAHSSIACFLSHCGWNSTVEGLSMGVPFLCWPYFSDQFHNQNYICDVWKIGLRLNPDENGLRSRHEIMTKIEMLLSEYRIKVSAIKLKEMVLKNVSGLGSSSQNFDRFIDHLKN
ncbi:UDP-glycosyltransferase 83A1-like [Olea europaea subsp. europaea]|uniref:UDP-glycosyltransferase 83A1-like n=1 Tax=Olea europaea subsp. europaea TaxID=158383 RepID=A0A8S0VKG8_OLEEU|nr:UDP-glycosyltransferase 83A1-like [Olea europaea subsp. europaea]